MEFDIELARKEHFKRLGLQDPVIGKGFKAKTEEKKSSVGSDDRPDFVARLGDFYDNLRKQKLPAEGSINFSETLETK